MKHRKWIAGCLLSCVVLATLSAGAQQVPAPGALPSLPHDPDHAERAATWCAIHVGRRELAHAISDCNYAIAANPKNAIAFSNRGTLYLTYGDLSQALADYEKALQLAPLQANNHYNRGVARGMLGRRNEAISDYTEAIRLNPDLAIAYHNRGREYEDGGDRARAVADYERALELDPKLEPSISSLKRLRGDL
jgi:tetratricopeptide (TPR) repeat protein